MEQLGKYEDGINPVNVLVVDDDKIVVRGLRRAAEKMGLSLAVHSAIDGLEALKMLKGEDEAAPIPNPYIVLLDLNMPRMNGHEFLKSIRQDPALQSMIIFVHTTSSHETDISDAYKHNIAGYMVKSDALDGMSKTLAMLDSYNERVCLPHG